MSTHIDTLAEWWENAEKADVIGQGDIVIEDRRDKEGGFDIWPASHRTDPEGRPDRRILSRAPKPAWHNAVAVIASNVNTERQVWERYMGTWCGTAGDEADSEDLTDVVPLIEAKVTDEMVQRIREASRDGRIKGSYRDVDGYYRDILTAALNLDPA